MLADVYADLKGYFQIIDPCVDPNTRRKQLNDVGKKIRSDLEHLERKKGWVYLGTMFKAWNEMDWGSILPPFAFEPSEELCHQLKKNRAKIDAQLAELSFERAKNLLNEVKKNNVARYTDRHRLVEKALDIVIDRCDSDKIWKFSNPPAYEIYAFITKCYLFRSRLALPKGSSIPEKKLEALKKGWEWVKKTSLPDVSDIDDDFSHWDKQQDQVVDNLKIEIVLEIKRWQPFVDDSWLKHQLKCFFNNTQKLDENNLIHWRVCDIAEEVGMPGKSKFLLNISNNNSRTLPLYQAKAAYRHNISMFNKYLEESIKKLNVPFSDPLWDETVKLIETAAADSRMNGRWEESAIQAWAQCENMAQKLRLSVQVRWYWARHRKLYDLAVRAAYKCKNVRKCAEIVDSQKNRPTVKLKNMETRLHSPNTLNEDRKSIEIMIEAETCFAIENYQAGLDILNKLPMSVPEKIRNLQDMPDDWGSVHFYVCEDKQAYAFVFTDQCCEKFTFSAENLWKKYVRWNTDVEKKDSFEKLCEEFGDCFKDIFCWLNDKASGVLFIPHGFLHLVPLHAAKVKKNAETKFLFEVMTCVYLPSWSLSPLKKQEVVNSGVYAFSNWQNWDTTPSIFCSSNWNNNQTVNNSADDIIYTIKTCESPPKLLVMYSHGKHDPNNPYQSSLIMNKSDLTHQMILKNIETGKLSGADIILTACETDLAPGDMGLADEHLSLANAFLTKDARAVLGTLYECKEDKSLELISKIKQTPGGALYQVLQNTQRQWFANNEQIEDIAVYRVMGFPDE